jgi:hypothetical protein
LKASTREAFARLRTAALPLLAWSGWTLALVIISVRVWFKPAAHSVFTVFREAGAHWLKAETLYGHGSKFLYSPLAGAWFSPFSFLPENIAGILWRLIGGALLTATAFIVAKTIWPRPADWQKPYWAVLALLPLAVSNLNNGQANPFVLALMLISIVALLRERWWSCALCLGFATYFKIYPLALGLLLSVLFSRQLSWRLTLSLIGFFIVSLLLQRPSYVLHEYVNWFAHLGSITRRSAGQFGTWRDAYFLLRIARIPLTPRGWLVVEAISGIAVAAFCAWGVHRNWHRERLMFAAFGLGSAWMVLFGPATEAASYILLVPAIVYGLLRSWTEPSLTRARIGMATAYCGLLVAEMCDSWLHLKHHFVYARSLQPIFALIFLGTAVAWLIEDKHWRRNSTPQFSE